MKKVIFCKTYYDEDTYDLPEDIGIAIDEDHGIPEDEHGFRKGSFKVTVEWSDEDE